MAGGEVNRLRSESTSQAADSCPYRQKSTERSFLMKYIMALDQGTTSSRCILFDKSGNICAVVNKEMK